jgi:hypothetical protein
VTHHDHRCPGCDAQPTAHASARPALRLCGDCFAVLVETIRADRERTADRT